MTMKWSVQAASGERVSMTDDGQFWANTEARATLRGVDIYAEASHAPAARYTPTGPRDEGAVYANVLANFRGAMTFEGDFPALYVEPNFTTPDPEDAGMAPDSPVKPQTKTLPPVTMATDDEPHWGGMIALLPDAESAAKLSVPGGDSLDQLHVTLAFLGDDATVFTEPQRDIIRAVASFLARGRGFPITASVPGSATLGDKANVYLLGDSPSLEFFHDDVWEALNVVTNKLVAGLPMERLPWIAHLTAAMDKPGITPLDLKYRGEVVFDRVRVAFGGEHTDIPLLTPADDDTRHPRLRDLAVGGFQPSSSPESKSELGLLAMSVSDQEVAAEAAEHLYGGETKAGPPGATYPSKNPGATKLRNYWTRGEGAAKIKWGVPHDFYRCRDHLTKYVGARASGLCAIYHRAALGVWPGQEGSKSLEDLFDNSALGLLRDIALTDAE